MSLDHEALAALMRSDHPPLIVDVRRAPAFVADPRRLLGALRRDPAAVADWMGDLPTGRRIVVYCVHGHEVSRGVRDRLRAAGHDAVILAGGFEGWVAAGHPVADEAQPAS